MARERLIYPFIQSDGSVDYGNGVIGPTKSDVQRANGSFDEPIVPKVIQEERQRISFLGRLPIGAKWGIRFGVPAFALAIIAAACSSEDSSVTEETPKADSQGYLAGEVVDSESQVNIEPFLDWPFDEELAIGVQRGWKYVDDDGILREHKAVDFILGQVDFSGTWRSFDIMAAAEGEACANPPNRQGNAVFITHEAPQSTTLHTYYGHLYSIVDGIPECSDGESVPVARGQHLGWAGSTGAEDARWIHLHFQVNRNGQPIDPYDIRGFRNQYPDIAMTNGQHCGENTLWLECPIGFVQAEDVTSPTDSELSREEQIELNWLIIEQKTRRFFELLKSGSAVDLDEARRMLVPENKRSSWNSYNLGSYERALADCGWEVSEGSFQNLSIERRGSPKAILSRLDLQNIEEGLAPRDTYTLSISFEFRDWNSSFETPDGRGPYRSYDGVDNNLFLRFEDVDGELLIADLAACLKSPLGTVVGQPVGR